MGNVYLVVKMIPLIVAIMKAIEEAIPGQGAGEAKLAAVRGVLEASTEGVNELWPLIAKTIGVLVVTFNKVGWEMAQAKT